jgi:hypothetical protein
MSVRSCGRERFDASFADLAKMLRRKSLDSSNVFSSLIAPSAPFPFILASPGPEAMNGLALGASWFDILLVAHLILHRSTQHHNLA